LDVAPVAVQHVSLRFDQRAGLCHSASVHGV
jgi:hypothetical protein